ncbi:hypothetical protein [Roseimicrobium sp. ORNL1]|uniref:hypothetical protein n=1 Tax=Roseimicrobium sp. ORNL1 TaxID=2711231 RepID=UPI0013E127C7|nr:hypothetical protein [Roseimicrobium sp. ORNL1]QIF04801.1 hypothetical protein G5S37_25895 [Roseimicrobium sp. ORNL1]
MRSIVTFLVGLSLAALACGAEPPAANPAKAPRETYPLYGRVVSISSQTLVIKGGSGKPDRSFALSPNLTIKKDEKPATLADVVAGQWVGGSVRKTATGPPLLEKLNLSVKQKP